MLISTAHLRHKVAYRFQDVCGFLVVGNYSVRQGGGDNQ